MTEPPMTVTDFNDGGDYDLPPRPTYWWKPGDPWHCTTDHRSSPCDHCSACATDAATATRTALPPRPTTARTGPVRPGYYRHFRGKVYRVLGMVSYTTPATPTQMVLHAGVDSAGLSLPDLYVRDFADFDGTPESGAALPVRRFTFLGPTVTAQDLR